MSFLMWSVWPILCFVMLNSSKIDEILHYSLLRQGQQKKINIKIQIIRLVFITIILHLIIVKYVKWIPLSY